MKRRAALATCILCLAVGAGQGRAAEPSATSITTLTDPTGVLLKKWAAEGTAAGNTGDQYDNRDRAHSYFEIAKFPQFSVIPYTDAQKKANADWGAQTRILPGIVMGNSSTAAEVTGPGSNPRLYYSVPGGLAFLTSQYVNNNLYIYPAHRDCLQGRDGNPLLDVKAYGDVFPANSPYLIISLYSSWSDQPFMNAVAATLAAFRPEVKSKLSKSGTLMPTIQMILRMAYVKDPKDYLTGAAHPTVFDGGRVDMKRMVEMAHEMTLDSLPPFTQIKVAQEQPPKAGKDFFDVPPTEVIGDSPFAVARVFRSTAKERKIILTTDGSGDLTKKPITLQWVVLRGDPKQITIKPLNNTSTRVEVTIPYHEWAIFQPNSGWGSNRVDIGVFAYNGTYYSPPAFFTDFSLDCESRAYRDDGKILEMGYDTPEAFLVPDDYGALLDGLTADKPSPAMQLLLAGTSPAQVAVLRQVAPQIKLASNRLKGAKKYLDDATASKVQDDITNASKTRDIATTMLNEVLDKTPPGLDVPPRLFLSNALARLRDDPELAVKNAALVNQLVAAAPAARRNLYLQERGRLLSLGMIKNTSAAVELTPLRTGNAPLAQRLTPYEISCLQRFNAELLATILFPGGVTDTLRIRYVDYRVTSNKDWRDVYHYDDVGNPLGWTRYAPAGPSEFTADGFLVLEKDAQGRPTRAAEVTYDRTVSTDTAARPRGAEDRQMWAPLTQRTSSHIVVYDYANPTDRTGKFHDPR